eukprot:scaffold39625_cov39-Phaeocystis_antarctica.AAC.1
MSALSLALRQSACQSERNGSGPQEVAEVKGYGGAVAFTHAHRATRMQPGRCSHLPHVHPRQPRLDRVKGAVAAALQIHQRPLKGLLLLRAHHHVECCTADLGV